ncbi:MAG: hypothetical protein QXG03_11910 [Halalkalicoccus sp.]
MSTAAEDEGFLAFYRSYAHTGIHTITATALTAFGLLTFVHRGFVVLAIAVYVLPPIYLYLTRDGNAPEPVDGAATVSDAGSNGHGPPAEKAAANAEAPSESPGDAPERAGAEPADPSPSEPDAEPAARSDSEPARSSGPGAGTASSPRSSGANERAVDDGSVESVDLLDHRAESVDPGWTVADAPTDAALFDAVSTPNAAYAAGAGGVLLARTDDEWELALESGPSAASETLRGVDAADDGWAVWIAGDGGALGRYDPDAGRHTDHSAPREITDNWTALAVAGEAGEERVALANGSGQVLLGSYDGETVAWDEPVKPGSGSSMSAIAFVGDALGYCCDTNAGVYRIREGEFERIGIDGASGFDALAATKEEVAAASDDGTVQRFDGAVWTPVRVAEDGIEGLATDGGEWLAVGAGGAIYENSDGDWEQADSPTEAALFAVAAGDVAVAVGENGTVVERVR